MNWSSSLPVKIFAEVLSESCEAAPVLALARYPWVKGFTIDAPWMTDATRQFTAGDYENFARAVVAQIPDRPVSFDVFSDDFAEMESQAREMAGWGENVYVKIPVTNTRGESSNDLLRGLARDGLKINVTGLVTLPQVRSAVTVLAEARSAFISVEAGGIADTGRDPAPVLSAAVDMMRPHKHLELMWSSSREMLNVMQASRIGCHAIQLPPGLLQKLPLIGKNLTEHSLDLIRERFDRTLAAGFMPATASIRDTSMRNLEFTLNEAARVEEPAAR